MGKCGILFFSSVKFIKKNKFLFFWEKNIFQIFHFKKLGTKQIPGDGPAQAFGWQLVAVILKLHRSSMPGPRQRA